MPKPLKIKLHVNEQKKITADPDPRDLLIRVGDTMHFDSDHGPVEIQFNPSVFSTDNFDSKGDPIHVVRAGEFVGTCTITLPGGEQISGYVEPHPGVSGRAED